MEEITVSPERDELPATLAEPPGSLVAMSGADGAPALPDVEIVKQAATGDHAAFTTLFYQTYRYAFVLVAAILPSDREIRDVLQEVYTRVYTGLPRLREPEAFLGWLKVIAQNCALTQRSKMAVDPLSTAIYLGDVEETFLAKEEPREEALDIHAVLETLPEEQARLLVLVYYDGLKLADIARMQGLPPSTVRSRFAAAKRALQEALKGRGIDRAVYGRGGFFSSVATALRDAIGTDVLSATVAQDVLDAVLNDSKATPLGHVAAKFSRRRRNAAVLRIAALVVALSLAASAIMVAVMTGRDSQPVSQPVPPTTTTSETTNTTTTSSEGEAVVPPVATTTATETEGSQGTTPTEVPPFHSTAGPEGTTPTSPTPGSTTADAAEGTTVSTLLTAGTTTTTTLSEGTQTTRTTRVFPPITKRTTTTTKPTTTRTTKTITTGTAKPVSTTARPTTTTRRTTTTTRRTTTTTTMAPIVVPETFVPDYRPGHANVLGNNAVNVERWRAFIAEQDGWLYFFTESNRLMKQNMETGHTTPIYQAPTGDTIRALNAVGDWLYFANKSKGIMRIRTDGSRLEQLSSLSVDWLLVRREELFYTHNSNLYVMDIPTRKASVVEYSVSSAYVCEKVVYYDKRVSANDFDLYQWTKENGSELISATAEYFLANGDTTVYYRMGNGMVARSQDGQERFYPWDLPLQGLAGTIWEYGDWLVAARDMIRQMRLSDGVFANDEYLTYPPTDLSVAGLKSGLYWWQNGALRCRKRGSLSFFNEEILWKP